MFQVVMLLDHKGETSVLASASTSCQSTLYDTGQYEEEIQRIRRIAFSSGDWSWDFETTGEYSSEEHPYHLPNSSREYSDRLTNSGSGIQDPANCSNVPSFTQNKVTVLDVYSPRLLSENNASMTPT